MADGPTPATDRVEVLDLAPTDVYAVPERGWRLPINLYAVEGAKLAPMTVKNWVYRRLGVEIGADTAIAPHVLVDPFHPEKITIGSGCMVGWGSKLLTHEAYTDEWHVGPLEIGDEVTIGHGTATRPGVTIGDGATVAAESFVDRDVEPGERVGGTPIESL